MIQGFIPCGGSQTVVLFFAFRNILAQAFCWTPNVSQLLSVSVRRLGSICPNNAFRDERGKAS